MIAVTGDVHGCYGTLKETVSIVSKKYNISEWYFLGDVVDKGTRSLEAVRLLIDIKAVLLHGNHEEMMLSYLRGDGRYSKDTWFKKAGGDATVASFSKGEADYNSSVKEVRKYFEPYMDFFESSLIYKELDIGGRKFLLSHAGPSDRLLPPDKQILASNEGDMRTHPAFLWTREEIYNTCGYLDYIIIFGHTPVFMQKVTNTPDIPYFINNIKGELKGVALDTGCVYGHTLSTMIIDDSGEIKTLSVRCRD